MHEATRVPFRDLCTHCVMVTGRTHHHITKQKIGDRARKPTNAVNDFFVRMKCAVSAQAMSEKAITCIAVKEDRHQNFVSSVALKNGVEEPWTIDRGEIHRPAWLA